RDPSNRYPPSLHDALPILSLPPRSAKEEPLPQADAKFLRAIARRTWRFFDTFAGAEDNFLPPDNFQQLPQPIVAHRTSPTNIGRSEEHTSELQSRFDLVCR